VGRLAALIIGPVAAVAPPGQWASTDLWRGALGLWASLALPALGAAAGALRADDG